MLGFEERARLFSAASCLDASERKARVESKEGAQ